ncbi:MAG: FG-GAP repeat domain-containing protein [Bdellovibrionota bacterium]
MRKRITLFLLAFFCIANASFAVLEMHVSPNFDGKNTELYLYANSGKKVLVSNFSTDGPLSRDLIGTAKVSRPINATFMYEEENDRYPRSNKAFVQIDKKKIKWFYNNTHTNTIFGNSVAYVLTGCDFDGDGITELAVVNTDRNRVTYRNTINNVNTRIRLPRKGYNSIICADVLGNGEMQIVAKKQLNKKPFFIDVVDKNSSVKYRGVRFGGKSTTQGSIIALDINNDGKDEIGFVRKAAKNNKTQVIFLKNINNLKEGTARYNLPRAVVITDNMYSITPSYANNALGFNYKSRGKFYNYNITTKKNVQFNAVSNVFGNIKPKNINLVKKSEMFKLAKTSTSTNSKAVQCDTNRGKGNGFLWKGVGEAYGHVSVAILPIYNKASTCQVVASDNSKSEDMWCSSQGANPWGGVKRQHWRARSTCRSFKTPSILRCKIGNKWNCWTISSPCARIE